MTVSTLVPTAVKFVAVVAHVQEVILSGAADLGFWQSQLRPAGLWPYAPEGQAQLSLSAADLHWLGTHTCELTISLPVSLQPRAATPDGQYLVHAFNSSALFAWVERSVFRTPYAAAGVRLACSRVQMHVADALGPIFSAAQDKVRPVAVSADEQWQGTIFLPQRAGAPREYFVARLGGVTDVFPFVPGVDTLRLMPRAEYPAFKWLLDSHFAPQTWRVRGDATHARSKTFDLKP